MKGQPFCGEEMLTVMVGTALACRLLAPTNCWKVLPSTDRAFSSIRVFECCPSRPPNHVSVSNPDAAHRKPVIPHPKTNSSPPSGVEKGFHSDESIRVGSFSAFNRDCRHVISAVFDSAKLQSTPMWECERFGVLLAVSPPSPCDDFPTGLNNPPRTWIWTKRSSSWSPEMAGARSCAPSKSM